MLCYTRSAQHLTDRMVDPDFVLSMSKKPTTLPHPLYKLLISTLATRLEIDAKELRRIFPQALTTVVPYGRARMVDGNEPIHGCQLVKLAPDHRDMSFIRVGICPTFLSVISDANCHNLLLVSA
jgi:hypothetical protein